MSPEDKKRVEDFTKAFLHFKDAMEVSKTGSRFVMCFIPADENQDSRIILEFNMLIGEDLLRQSFKISNFDQMVHPDVTIGNTIMMIEDQFHKYATNQAINNTISRTNQNVSD